MERLTEKCGDRWIPKQDIRNNGHDKCMAKLAEYEDAEDRLHQHFKANITLIDMLNHFVTHVEAVEGEPLKGFRILTNENAESYDKWKSDKDAEEQGLLIKLPCKVGDTLYWLTNDEMTMHRVIRTVTAQCFVWWYTHGFCVKIANMVENISCRDIPFSEFGKTLFTTPEAAEEALKGVMHHEN